MKSEDTPPARARPEAAARSAAQGPGEDVGKADPLLAGCPQLCVGTEAGRGVDQPAALERSTEDAHRKRHAPAGRHGAPRRLRRRKPHAVQLAAAGGHGLAEPRRRAGRIWRSQGRGTAFERLQRICTWSTWNGTPSSMSSNKKKRTPGFPGVLLHHLTVISWDDGASAAPRTLRCRSVSVGTTAHAPSSLGWCS